MVKAERVVTCSQNLGEDVTALTERSGVNGDSCFALLFYYSSFTLLPSHLKKGAISKDRPF
jgi:hypothetical protein